MEIINSVFTICSTVSETEREYKILAKRLQYELQKAMHLMKSEKVKNLPQFIVDNLKKSIQQAKVQLSKIQKLLKKDSIPLTQKIKLSLPFNKTNQNVKLALQNLQKAQQDVSNYEFSYQQDKNCKRFLQQQKFLDKRQQTRILNSKDQDVNDEDIQQAVMGPTIEQDAAIQFSKNRYINMNIQIKGQKQIIQTIKKIDQSVLNYKKKIQIKFEHSQKLIQQIQLFSLGRIYFKQVYGKLKGCYPDIDRISKSNHFVIKLRRRKQNIQQNNQNKNHQQKQSKNKPNEKNQKQEINQVKDQFFSFPQHEQIQVFKQIDTIIVQKSNDKNLYFTDNTGMWKKIDTNQKQICRGDEIAAFISPNRLPPIPDLYFKINFEILE